MDLRKVSNWLSYGGLICSTGFALFCMFFGSGNLIFPLLVGHDVQMSYPIAIVGFCVTGVLVPFLGLVAIMLYQGSYKIFFSRLDKVSRFIIPFIILLLIGPLAVIPRCMLVGCGSLCSVWEGVDMPVLGALFGVAVFLCILDKRKIVPLLGSVLTPVLLFAFALIIYYGVKESVVEWPIENTMSGFWQGITQGYQLMDLLASFFFASTLVSYMKNKLSHPALSPQKKNRVILAAMIFGALLLGIIYSFLIYLGAAYGALFSYETAEQSLSIVAHHTLGLYAGPVVSTTIFLACFTTAMVLTEVSAEFFHEKIFLKKIPLHIVMVMVLAISYLCSMLKFQGIVNFLFPILNALYPTLIVFTLVSIAHKLWGFQPLKRLVYATLVITVVLMLVGVL